MPDITGWQRYRVLQAGEVVGLVTEHGGVEGLPLRRSAMDQRPHPLRAPWQAC